MPIVRAELFKIKDDAYSPVFQVVLTNVRRPTGSKFERQEARFDTVSIEKDGETVRSNIFCKCGTSGPCGAPFQTIAPGDAATFEWDGRSDMCEILEPGEYEISIFRRCQDPDSLYRKLCEAHPQECNGRISDCFEYREAWRIQIS